MAIRTAIGRSAIMCLALSCASLAQAGPLGLTPQTPELLASDVFLQYDSTTPELFIDGEVAGGSLTANELLFTVTAEIDNAGAFSGGTFTLEEYASNGGSLIGEIIGDLTDYARDADLFDFLATVTSDSTTFAGTFGIGTSIGVSLEIPCISQSCDFDVNVDPLIFDGEDGNGSVFAQGASIPVPSPPAALLVLFALGFAGWRRNRDH